MEYQFLDVLHKAERELLVEVLNIFETYNIRYYAIGGTLLGAVREKGFIPWDDDIDLAVPREDYQRLIEIMNSPDYRSGDDGNKDSSGIVGIKYYKWEPDLYYYPVRLVHRGYEISDSRMKDKTSNPWIDILPIDGWPEGRVKGRIFKAKMLWYRFLLGLHYADNLRNKKRSMMEKIIIKTAQITKVGKLINPTKVKDRIDKTLSENDMNECKFSGTCMGAYFFHEFVPTSYFGSGITVEFDGLDIVVPEKINKYLTHMYGKDYMIPKGSVEENSHINSYIVEK